MEQYILWFENCGYHNKSQVGGKNASLGELKRLSKKLGFSIADGFAITTKFYDDYISFNDLESLIHEEIDSIDFSNLESLDSASQRIKSAITYGRFSEFMEKTISDAYTELIQIYSPNQIQVAIRSSAVAEDLPHASFAGQQDTYLNIISIQDVLLHVKKCIASLFNAQVISYRHTHQIKFGDIKLSVGVQKMVRSDLGSAGVAFSIDPETGYKGAVIINSSFGLGELVVSGQVKPDEIEVDKRLQKLGVSSIVSKKMGDKKTKIVYSSHGTQEIMTSPQEQTTLSLTDAQAKELAWFVISLEEEYSQLFEKNISVDVEWAVDGDDQKIYIIQTRPETVHSNNDSHKVSQYILDERSSILLEGVAVGERISAGKVCILHSIKDHKKFSPGDILVTEMTTPDWEPIMKQSSGIITNKGGRTCHAAIIARELGINAIVGTQNAATILQTDQEITMSCAEGEVGKIYESILPFHVDEITLDSEKLDSLPVRLMLNVGNPETAFHCSMLPNSGVGLVRMEFTINNYIGIHPLALLNHATLPEELQRKVTDIIESQEPKQYFVDQLAIGLGKIASAFYPKDVIVRFSDFKSNEYKNLLGGDMYEPDEENPMLGWRGCSRYYSQEYEEAFGLECEAILKLRNEMQLTNIIVMLPFCRTPEECCLVEKTMSKYGLVRGENGLQVYIMCEIPSNVLEAKGFSPYIDGVSIGGNDLLQLTLGVDRDSSKITQLSDHTNRSYRKLIKKAVHKYKKHGKKVGFCGQQPSESTEFAKYLADCGIDSISVIYDTLIKTINNI